MEVGRFHLQLRRHQRYLTAGGGCTAGGSVYCGTKHFLDAYTTAARHDLVGTNIRVTVISPGELHSLVTYNTALRLGLEGAGLVPHTRPQLQHLVPKSCVSEPLNLCVDAF